MWSKYIGSAIVLYREDSAHAFALNRYSIVFAIILLGVSKSLSSYLSLITNYCDHNIPTVHGIDPIVSIYVNDLCFKMCSRKWLRQLPKTLQCWGFWRYASSLTIVWGQERWKGCPNFTSHRLQGHKYLMRMILAQKQVYILLIGFERLALYNRFTWFLTSLWVFFCLNPESYISVTVLVAA